jgi:hypothetical protein
MGISSPLRRTTRPGAEFDLEPSDNARLANLCDPLEMSEAANGTQVAMVPGISRAWFALKVLRVTSGLRCCARR